MYRILTIAVCILLFSCNPMGKKIAEIPLSLGDITTADSIALKKGDIITFWSKIDLSYKQETPSLKYKYNISSNDVSLVFDSTYADSGNHTVHSKREKGRSYESDDENHKTDSLYYTDWTAEVENNSFTAPKDGNYTFDLKMYKTNLDSFFGRNEAVIVLRKK